LGSEIAFGVGLKSLGPFFRAFFVQPEPFAYFEDATFFNRNIPPRKYC
jgi:hypothetical protein